MKVRESLMEEVAFLSNVDCVLKDKIIGSGNLGWKEYKEDCFVGGCN